MTPDPAVNFGIVEVSTGYDDNDTSVVLTTGEGSKIPDPASAGAFNLIWWNSTDFANPADDPNREIVRVTARSTDTLTVTRGQESITATSKNTANKTYKMARVLTKKDYDDLTGAVKVGNFTRDISLTSAQAITGVGFLPKAVRFIAAVQATSVESHGFDDGTNRGCRYDNGGAAAGTHGVSTSKSILMLVSTGVYSQATVQSFDADGFTLAWSKAGSPTGTATIIFEALK